MDISNNKCSSKEHEDINAICYCFECKVYMCNKCEIFHSKLFHLHHSYKLDKNLNDVFTGFCKEENHNEKLEFFCKIHNQLCCGLCLCKIKDKGKGQHKDCDVCIIEKIEEEKKQKLKDNIKMLEDLSNNFENSINELKKIFENINEKKEIIKTEIQKIFTKLRTALNEREDELLSDVNKQFNTLYFTDDLFKESEKLPNKIKLSLEKGKIIDNEWNNKDNLNSLINDCINIENNIKDINKINDIFKKYKESKDNNVKFVQNKDNEINEFLAKIKDFGKICIQEMILGDSLIIKNNITYINNLENWINPKKKFQSKLLYRKSRDGDSYDTFHKLCDNQGPTLVLIKTTEQIIFGGYTPLNWDNYSSLKHDNDTFLFSLTNSRIFKKYKKDKSILCDRSCGPFFPYIGFRNVGKKNMSQGVFQYTDSSGFEDHNKVIPNEGKNRFFDVEEVEIYKIFFE